MTTDRTTWKWDQDQLDFLFQQATSPRSVLVEAFRKKFGLNRDTLSDTGIAYPTSARIDGPND